MAGIPVDVAKKMQRENLSEMRKDYTRMRDMVQKRIKRMGESEFARTKTYQEHAEGFPKLKNIKPENFAKAYSELSKFLGAKRGSVTGQKEIKQKTINTWNKEGIPLNNENYFRVIDILEEMRRRKVVYGSDSATELANLTLELSDEQFDKVLDNLGLYITNLEDVRNAMVEMKDPQTGYTEVNMSEFTSKIGW